MSNEKKMFLCRVIRIITVAPIAAYIAVTLLMLLKPATVGGAVNYIMSVLFLTALPLTAYPLQPFLPHFRGTGRKGQRDLAIIIAALCYLLGTTYCFVFSVPPELKAFFLTYLISGFSLLFINKLLRFRASGHACGVVGPIAFMCVYLSPYAALGIIIALPIYKASLKMKRHTLPEFVIGAVVPIVSLLIAMRLA